MSTKTGTADTLATRVANGLIDMELMWQRAEEDDSPGGIEIVNSEAQEIRAIWRSFAPRAGCLTQTLEVISTAASSANGVCSDGFVKKITPLKRGMNVTMLYPEFDEAA